MLKLYGANLSSPSNKIRFLLNYLNVDYAYEQLNLRQGDHRKPEFLAINPAGKIPALDDNGFYLFESNAICRYLCEKYKSNLYPTDLQKRARVEQWIDFASLHILMAMNRVVFNRIFAPRIGVSVDENSLNDGLKFLDRFLPVIEKQLSEHDYVVGKDRTLADFVLLAALDPCEVSEIDLSKYAGINRWRDRERSQEYYQKCYTSYEEVLTAAMKG